MLESMAYDKKFWSYDPECRSITQNTEFLLLPLRSKLVSVTVPYFRPCFPCYIHKTVITTPFVFFFEFVCMPFGQRKAAQTLQRFMDQMLHGLLFVYAYIDNVLIASTSKEHSNISEPFMNACHLMVSSSMSTRASSVFWN